MQADAYATIAELYDLEHSEFTDDIELLLEIADLGSGRIAELGCGSGRVLIPLAEHGHDVVGIDASEPMLAKARKAIECADLSGSISLVHGDMAAESSFRDGPFGLILASLNSLMHLTSQAQQIEMLEVAWKSLLPGGRLVIDTLNPSTEQLNHLLNVTHLEGSWALNDGSTIDKWGHRKPAQDAQVIDTLIWYDQTMLSGEITRTRTRFELRYVHQSELALMLQIVGFRQADWYGTYELDPWHAESDRIIVIAHKD